MHRTICWRNGPSRRILERPELFLNWAQPKFPRAPNAFRYLNRGSKPTNIIAGASAPKPRRPKTTQTLAFPRRRGLLSRLIQKSTAAQAHPRGRGLSTQAERSARDPGQSRRLVRLPTSNFNKLETRKIKQREGLQLLTAGLQCANRIVNIVLSRFVRERETKGALGTFGRQPHRNKYVRGLAFMARAGASARRAHAPLVKQLDKRSRIDAHKRHVQRAGHARGRTVYPVLAISARMRHSNSSRSAAMCAASLAIFSQASRAAAAIATMPATFSVPPRIAPS